MLQKTTTTATTTTATTTTTTTTTTKQLVSVQLDFKAVVSKAFFHYNTSEIKFSKEIILKVLNFRVFQNSHGSI